MKMHEQSRLNGLERHIRKKKTCPECQSLLPYEKRKNNFCGRSCSSRYWYKHSDKTSASRKKTNLEDAETDRVRKRILVEQNGHRCEVCLGTTWCGQPIPLVLDHVNGNPEDNSRVNLRLVCGNCDMQLPTYKNKNRGNGRSYRRKRYSEGKIF